VNPNERTLTRIITVWNSVIRKVFNIKCEDVGCVSAFIEDKSLRDVTSHLGTGPRRGPLSGSGLPSRVEDT